MEKYGVWTREEKHIKTAGPKSCPRCGTQKVTYGTVPKCSNCGTAPWEKKANAQKEQQNRWNFKQRIR